MRVLLTLPHIFAPREGSVYSSQTEAKRPLKTEALRNATLGNHSRHRRRHWIHASLGRGKQIVTRALNGELGVELTIQIYTDPNANLLKNIPANEAIQIHPISLEDPSQLPMYASRRAIEQAESFDLIGYLEDDLLIEDPEFFHKISFLVEATGGDYAFLPHRCERIPDQGEVILSGDPDDGEERREELFWNTGEVLHFNWPLGERRFYRAINPHSGCYFLTRDQGVRLRRFWEEREWKAPFQLSGPLEQAGSGILLPQLKLMKPVPEHHRFLMIHHHDQLWVRHGFESDDDRPYDSNKEI